MTRDLLARFGEALYGPLWQEPLARALGVSGRSVRYWLAGRYDVPPGVWDELRELALERGEELAALADQVSASPS